MFRVLARASRAIAGFAAQPNQRFPIPCNQSQPLSQDLPIKVENGGSDMSDAKVSEGGDTQAADQTKESGSVPDSKSGNVRRQRNLRGATKRTAFSDSDSTEDLSIEDLVKLLTEKEELLKQKHKEVEKMQDKVLRTCAEMENVMDRTRREAENTKKFSIQVYRDSKIDIIQPDFPVLKKYGIEKYDPTNEPFDPHRHDAVFQVSDPSKPPGTVAQVLKPGYVIHDRVIRPAEENNATGGDGGN